MKRVFYLVPSHVSSTSPIDTSCMSSYLLLPVLVCCYDFCFTLALGFRYCLFLSLLFLRYPFFSFYIVRAIILVFATFKIRSTSYCALPGLPSYPYIGSQITSYRRSDPREFYRSRLRLDRAPSKFGLHNITSTHT